LGGQAAHVIIRIIIIVVIVIDNFIITSDKTIASRGGYSPKILGGGISPICSFITESILSVLRNRKNTNFI